MRGRGEEVIAQPKDAIPASLNRAKCHLASMVLQRRPSRVSIDIEQR